MDIDGTVCECCWSLIDGDVFELDECAMCEQCFEYHGGFEMIKMAEQTFSDTNYDWEGWYRLDDGNFVYCTEYIGSSSWAKEWEGCDTLPDGAIYYSIYDDSKEEIDGGVMGYMNGETFSNLIEFLQLCNQGRIIEKLSDDEIEFLGLNEYV